MKPGSNILFYKAPRNNSLVLAMRLDRILFTE